MHTIRITTYIIAHTLYYISKLRKKIIVYSPMLGRLGGEH